jgi:multidrug efflux pump subunit AcrA (membrane-fusion protein)
LVLGFLGAGAAALPSLLRAEPVDRLDRNKRTVQIKVPSQRNGIVLVIGTEIKAGEKVAADQVVTIKVNGAVRKYRRLQEGDAVEQGQLLVQLDDRLARDKVAIHEVKVHSSDADYQGSVALYHVYQGELDRLEKIRQKAGQQQVSAQEYAIARAQRDKYREEANSKKGVVQVARRELQKAQTALEMYQVRSPVTGVVRRILKRPSEAARKWETVLVIEVARPRK